MPLKILRLGYTETTLLFIYWMNNVNNINNNDLVKAKNTFIKWLYTTSGYYDKQIISSYMNAEHKNNDPAIYIKYMEFLLNFMKNCDIASLALHKINNNEQYCSDFKFFFNSACEKHINNDIIYKFIDNKKILIISPFANLFKNQILSGNVAKIYNNMTNVESIYAYQKDSN